jgi:hypothetical protein
MNEPTAAQDERTRMYAAAILPPSFLKGDNAADLMQRIAADRERPPPVDQGKELNRLTHEMNQYRRPPTPEEQAMADMQAEYSRRVLYQLHGEASRRATTAMPLPEVPADFDAA